MAVFGFAPTLTPHYLDRTDLRLQIQQHFLDHQNTSTSVVITGMNGCGKTQLAAHIAQEASRSKTYAYIAWITPNSLEHLHSLLIAMAKQFDVPISDNTFDLINKIYNAISVQHKNSLLIFDDINFELEDPMLLRPEKHNIQDVIHAVFTTVNPQFCPYAFKIYEFTQDECYNYIKMFFPENETHDIDRLRVKLGNHPLALAQAMSYMQMTGENIRGYISLLDEKTNYQQRLFETNIGDSSKTIWTTWDVSIEHVLKTKDSVSKLLRYCIFLYNEKIPKNLLTTLFKDRLELNDTISILSKYSLISNHSEGDYISLNSMTQQVLQLKYMDILFKEIKIKTCVEELLAAVRNYFNFDTRLIKKASKEIIDILPHSMTIIKFALQNSIQNHDLYEILHTLGLYQYFTLGHPRAAMKTLMIARSILKQLGQGLCLQLARLDADLAAVYTSLGHYQDAIIHHQRSARFFYNYNAEYDNPEIALAVSNLGVALQQSLLIGRIPVSSGLITFDQHVLFGKENTQYKPAYILVPQLTNDIDNIITHHETLLHILAEHFGETHFLIGREHYNLSSLYCYKNDLAQSQYHINIAIKLYEKRWSANNIETLMVHNLEGIIQFLTGQLSQALETQRNVYEIAKQYQQENEHVFANIIFHYAAMLLENNQKEEAKKYFIQCDEMEERFAHTNNIKKSSILIQAVKYGYHHTAQWLIDTGFSLISERDQEGNTVIHAAAITNFTDIIDELINRGVNLEARNSYGHTPLGSAIQAGAINAFEALMKHLPSAADKAHHLTNIDSHESSPLVSAIVTGQYQMTDHLLRKYFDHLKIDTFNDYGYSPLFCARIQKHKKISDLLIQYGASRNLTNQFGLTPESLINIMWSIINFSDADFLLATHDLQDLVLCGKALFQLTSNQFCFLLNALKFHPTIERLNIPAQRYSKKILKSLLALIESNSQIRYINLSAHAILRDQYKISNNDALFILKALNNNSSIIHIDFSNHLLTEETLEMFHELFNRNRELQDKENPIKNKIYSVIFDGEDLEMTRREAQCLLLLHDGLSAKQSANELHLSQRTVEIYLDKLKKRFKSRTKIELMSKINAQIISALRNQLNETSTAVS
ncbi:MAG: ankyrin repeat domain-containing protein [Gammaproteobacteria bacterium]|nr:ankyrin repeat domain-containing protein [Gammaproteobacteria bacterium]